MEQGILNWRTYSLGAALFAGLTAIFGKIGLQGVPANVATLIRTIVVIPVLVLMIQTSSEWVSFHHLSRVTMVFLLLSGICTALSWSCFYHALQLGPACLVSAIDKSSFLVTVLIAAAFLGERLSLSQWIGVAFMATGLAIIVLNER